MARPQSGRQRGGLRGSEYLAQGTHPDVAGEGGRGRAHPGPRGRSALRVLPRERQRSVALPERRRDGKELWQDKYEALGATGPASSFFGPRSSPAVASGRVVTLGVRGMLSSLDAASGKVLWRKDDFHAYPMFHPASSPMIVDGLAIAQLGGRENGALIAYDLTTGAEKWRWSGPSPSYASPVLLTVGGSKLIVANTEARTVAINAADGKLAWESAPAEQGGGGGGGRGMGGGRDYKAATPIVDGQIIIMAGRGVTAVKIEKAGDKFVGKPAWSNPDKSVQFNTPVVKNGWLFGLSGNNEVFCLSAKDGKTAWAAPLPAAAPARAAIERLVTGQTAFGLPVPADPAEPGRPGGPGGQGGQGGGRRGPGGPGGQGAPGGPGGPGGGRRGGGGMGGGGGFGSIVDAGLALLALTPAGQLVVFETSDKEFKLLGSYKVGSQTHSYPVVSGQRLFIKDKDSVTLWTVK
jgi:outer membrane protein assembly factor BamB